jgi:hypothetical protein
MLPRLVGIAMAVLLIPGCSNTGIVDVLDGNGLAEAFATPGRSLQVRMGQELRLTIRTIGGGQYATPPEMEGTALTFIGARLADVQVPAGPTQVFSFVGLSRGTTIVRFHGTESAVVVTDTVLVR